MRVLVLLCFVASLISIASTFPQPSIVDDIFNGIENLETRIVYPLGLCNQVGAEVKGQIYTCKCEYVFPLLPQYTKCKLNSRTTTTTTTPSPSTSSTTGNPSSSSTGSPTSSSSTGSPTSP